MRIAYGYNRSEKDFDGFDIDPDMFTIDKKDTFEDERQVLGSWIREYKRSGVENVTVVILDNGDLGIGAGAAKFCKMIIDDGATIEGPNDRPSNAKKGRPEYPKLSPDDEHQICALRNSGNFKDKTLIARVKKEYGILLNRAQFNYICKRKLKREVEKAVKESTKSVDRKPK